MELYRKIYEDILKWKNTSNGTSAFMIEGLLKGVGNGFEVWRYCYEDDHKEFEEKYPYEYSEKFLMYYLPVLKDMAHKNKK